MSEAGGPESTECNEKLPVSDGMFCVVMRGKRRTWQCVKSSGEHSSSGDVTMAVRVGVGVGAGYYSSREGRSGQSEVGKDRQRREGGRNGIESVKGERGTVNVYVARTVERERVQPVSTNECEKETTWVDERRKGEERGGREQEQEQCETRHLEAPEAVPIRN